MHKRLHIGVFLENHTRQGGAFQQSITTIKALEQGLSNVKVIVLTPFKANIDLLRSMGFIAEIYSAGWIGKIDELQASSPLLFYFTTLFRRLGFSKFGRNLDAKLADLGIDIAFFSNYTTAQRLSDHPYIVTVWDLCHLDLPEFPGVSLGREFERLELSMRNVLTKATAVIVNCKSEASRIEQAYHVDSRRIICLPFRPSIFALNHAGGKRVVNLADVKRRYKLPNDYIFYPAQLCADKNHVYVIDALVALEKIYGHRIHAVFSGSNNGNQNYLERYAEINGLKQRIHFLGFVDNEEVPAIYDGAIALSMPTYCGPTNLPPLEAALLGCPVLYSDLPEWREFMKDAALYCDLKNPVSMATHIHNLISDPLLRLSVTEVGKKFAAEIVHNDYASLLQPIFDDFSYKRRRWE